MIDLGDFKWTVRLDMGPFLGNEDDRLIWHFLSPATTTEEAVAQMRRIYPNATAITAFPKPFG